MASSRETGNYYYYYADIYDTDEEKEERRNEREYRDELEFEEKISLICYFHWRTATLISLSDRTWSC